MTFYRVEIVRMHQVGADAIQIAIFVTFVNECSKGNNERGKSPQINRVQFNHLDLKYIQNLMIVCALCKTLLMMGIFRHQNFNLGDMR